MASTGLLVVSNIRRISQSLNAIQKYVKSLYIHLNIPATKTKPAPSWNKVITHIYTEGFTCTPKVDLKVLISPLKTAELSKSPNKKIDILFSDALLPEICDTIRAKFNIASETIFLADEPTIDIVDQQSNEQGTKVYNTVVLGGTFDRIHVGHKIFLSTAVLRACKKLVVGVTNEEMLNSKKLPELILPVEQRIQELREFLLDIDSTLQYEVVPITNAFGPTQVDPDMDMIVVSQETLRGGHKVNELREKNNLRQLEIYAIDMIEGSVDNEYKELKVSSSNNRMDLLGTRINKKQPRPNLAPRPYIIGLSGGIASGKSNLAKRLEEFGAFVIDCDKVAHEIYEPGQVCYEKIVEHFGKEIIGEGGRIDRRKLGAIVFADPKKLETLNSIVWPELLIEVKRRINKEHERNGVEVAVIEAAILHKAEWDKECHEIWSMIVSQDEAVKRIIKRNALSEEEARRRISSQLPNQTVVQRSNVVFSSEWCHDYTHKQAEKAWQMLQTELKEEKTNSKSCL